MLLAATDRHTVADRLHRFHDTVLTADLPEAIQLAETVDAWWPEILGFLDTRITNAGTESTNRMVKDAARIAFGFRNLDNQRRRVRFHYTRRSRRTTSAEAVKPPNFEEPDIVVLVSPREFANPWVAILPKRSKRSTGRSPRFVFRWSTPSHSSSSGRSSRRATADD